ncbi:expressed unknown protein [Seminavis robusta]|uniref:Uncharacterized protein n=1 Tax=Seminavis robusta TaxID=568900 RepID=A0A9N8F3Y1_9STRA|nr:expressed unknown protein [Seminavis robusta]|eukprot:Sro2821_g337910.1 n/a (188) ;mRNA; f:3284-3847
MEAVARCHDIQEVSVNNTQIHISPQSVVPARHSWLDHLCRLETLKILKLERMDEIKDHHIVCLARALHDNQTLRELSIESCHMEQSGGTALAELLGKRSNRLRHVSLQLFAKQADDSTAVETDNDWDKTGMAKALQHNRTFRFLRIVSENILKNGYPKAFLEMIRVNVTFQQLILGGDEETPADMEF